MVKDIATLLPLLEPAVGSQTALRKLRSVVWLYDINGCSLDDFAAFIASSLSHYECAWCAGTTGTMMCVYMFRCDFKYLPTVMDFGAVSPSINRPRLRGPGVNSKNAGSTAVRVLVSALRQFKTNMFLASPCRGQQEFSFEQMLSITGKLDDIQMLKLKGEAGLAQDKEKTSFQWALLKSYNNLKELRTLAKPSDIVFQAHAPPMQIVPLNMLSAVGLQQTGTVLDESTGNVLSFSLDKLFTTSLCLTYSVLICGANGTTGYGKSQIALRLAVELSTAIVESHGLPRSNARVVVATTLDSLRGIALPLGTVIVFDDLNPNDREQVVHLSENGMKALLNPRAIAGMRGRNNDIIIPLGVPRIFTANVVSGDEWCFGRLRWSLPLQRRCIVYNITARIAVLGWAGDARHDVLDAAAVAAHLLDAVALPQVPPPAPQPDVSMWHQLLRAALSMLFSAIVGPQADQ